MSDDVKNDAPVVEETTEVKTEEKAVPATEEVVETKTEVKEEKKDEMVKAVESAKPASTKVNSGKFKDLIEKIEQLTALELAELVKELEDRFGVSAAAPMAVAGAPVAGGDAGEEEKSSYNVVLKDGGSNKISAIKAVREVMPNLGLKEAKDLVDGAPKTLKENVAKEEAEAIKAKFEEAGATIELQ